MSSEKQTEDSLIVSVSQELESYRFREPEDWYCSVERYNIGHSELYVRADRLQNLKSVESIIIFFGATRYFEGPLRWRGADFNPADKDECVALLRRVGDSTEVTVDDPIRLYTVSNLDSEDSNAKVKIIARVTALLTVEEFDPIRRKT